MSIQIIPVYFEGSREVDEMWWDIQGQLREI